MKTMVLFSGGLDSAAALLWAASSGRTPHALNIYYGQPASQREVEAALGIARALGITERFLRLDVSGVYYGMSDGVFRPRSHQRVGGINTSFVPMRNPTLLACAAARALNLWPGEEDVRLVVGFNRQDADGFPDCRPEFVAAFEATMNLALEGRHVRIEAPWIERAKSEAVEWVREHCPGEAHLLPLSWSCYRDGAQHCGECTGCVTREQAFA